MRICYGWARKPITLSTEQRYHPEQLMNRLGPFNPTRKLVSPLIWMPVWIHMDGQYIRLDNKEEIGLACKLVCVYHNGPGNNAPFCDDEDSDWHDISEKEAFLAGVGEGEAESSGEDTVTASD
jgi:hypothetical protein